MTVVREIPAGETWRAAEAMLELPGRTGRYLAREATPAEWQTYWRRATEVYIGFPEYQKRTHGRAIPIIVLTPKPE